MVAAAAAATGSAVGAGLAGVVPAGFLFNPAAGDALVVGSLAFSFNGDGDAAFSGDDLRCAAAPVLVLLADNRGRRTVLEALVGAECVNLGAGRAVKVFVMVVVVVVVVWLAEPLIDVADLTRMLLLVAVDELAVLATPLASGLLGLRAPVMGPAAGAVLRIVDANVLRGEGTFGLAAALLAPNVPDVVAGLVAVVAGRRGFTWEAPVVPLVEVDAGLRIAEVVVVVRLAVAAVLGLLAESLLAGAVAGRVPAVLLPVGLGVDLAVALLVATGLRAAVLVGLAAPVAVVVEVVEAVVLGAGAVRGRAVAAAGLAAAVLPRDVFLVRAPAAAVGLALAADVAVVEAVFAAGFLAASPGEVLILGLEITAVAATAAAAATAATATSATGASSLGCSSATISAGSIGFSSDTASGICSTSFSASGSASGSATIGSTTAIAGCASCGGSEVSLPAWPFV